MPPGTMLTQQAIPSQAQSSMIKENGFYKRVIIIILNLVINY